MQAYLEQKIQQELDKKIAQLRDADLISPRYVTLKKDNQWLAKNFDQMINDFYDQEISNSLLKMPLPKNIEKEIYLLHWIKVNGYTGLVKNYQKTQDFLYKVNSSFYDRLNFYRYEFNKPNHDPNLLYRDFINNWESILVKRIIEYRYAKVEELREKFSQSLYNRIEIYQKMNRLLKSVWNFFGMMWDPELYLTQGTQMNQIAKFADFLENNPAIVEIANLLGRYQGQSKLIEEKIYERIVMDYEWKPVGSSPEEIIGATESKDLEHIFPAELVYLNDPVLKLIFYKKFIEGKLTTFEFLSQDKVPVEKVKLEVTKTVVPEEKGPIILCLDTSSSMRGSGEQIAKALALAVVKIALEGKRPCYMINFGSSLEVYNFANIKNSLPELIKFLSRSFSGDSNPEPALKHALEVMDHNEYFNADLLMISDFLMPDLDPNTTAMIKKLQVRRNRFQGIMVGTKGNENLGDVFDNIWVYDPRDSFASERIVANMMQELDDKYDKIPLAKSIFAQVIEQGGK